MSVPSGGELLVSAGAGEGDQVYITDCATGQVRAVVVKVVIMVTIATHTGGAGQARPRGPRDVRLHVGGEARVRVGGPGRGRRVLGHAHRGHSAQGPARHRSVTHGY